MNIPFSKMHGAGNDFIIIHGRDLPFSPPPALIATWCRRRTGIGADGLILILPPQCGGHFRMRFFNPDGQEAEMCGNGARCIARLARDLDLAPPAMTIETAGGRVQAMVDGEGVRLTLPPPRDIRLQQTLTLEDGAILNYDFANTGVPHVVIECDDLAQIPIERIGPTVRSHRAFAPGGANVSFITVVPPGTLRIRTYERGVEAETLACGTGIAAAAVTAVMRARVVSPVRIIAAGGDVLQVETGFQDGMPNALSLTGPAVYTYRGTLSCRLPDQGPV